jgi:hypothetical protein
MLLLPVRSDIFASCLLSKNEKIKEQQIVILPAVLYGCDETWSLNLTEEHRMTVFGSSVGGEYL